MQFPLTLTFANKDEYDSYILNNQYYIETLLHKNDCVSVETQQIIDLKASLESIQKKLLLSETNLEETTVKNNELEKILTLSKKSKHGESSVYKGEFGEKQLEYILRDELGNEFQVDGGGETHKMDIRLIHNAKDYSVGVEVKNKKNISKRHDLDKFTRDKVFNNFKGCVFVSTQSPVKNIVDIKNTWKIINDNEIYIYSDNLKFIGFVIKMFLQFLECDSDVTKENIRVVMDNIGTLYNTWGTTKTCLLAMDKQLRIAMNNMGLNGSLDKQLFLVSKSNCKGGKIPY